MRQSPLGSEARTVQERFNLLKDPSWRFEPEPHLGYLGERVLWGITGALRQSGIIKPGPFDRPEHLLRGTYVHEACQYFDEGTLDWSSIENHPYGIAGYVRAWEAFRQERRFEPRLVELPLYHPGLGFCGIPDREGLLDGEPTVVEIKSGELRFWTAYQTAAQDLLIRPWEENPPPYRRRWGISLRPDGTFKAIPFDDENDYEVFKAALVVSQAAGGVDRGRPPLEILT